MTALARIPPGRAGRLWLRGRFETAQRGRDQLDRKLQVLISAWQDLHNQHERLRRDWDTACRDADTLLLRAVLLGGQDAIRHAITTGLSGVQLAWTTSMRLRYPTDGSVVTAGLHRNCRRPTQRSSPPPSDSERRCRLASA